MRWATRMAGLVAVTLCCLPGLDVAWGQDTTGVAAEFSRTLRRWSGSTSSRTGA